LPLAEDGGLGIDMPLAKTPPFLNPASPQPFFIRFKLNIFVKRIVRAGVYNVLLFYFFPT
jgi:hypothetical protein